MSFVHRERPGADYKVPSQSERPISASGSAANSPDELIAVRNQPPIQNIRIQVCAIRPRNRTQFRIDAYPGKVLRVFKRREYSAEPNQRFHIDHTFYAIFKLNMQPMASSEFAKTMFFNTITPMGRSD